MPIPARPMSPPTTTARCALSYSRLAVVLSAVSMVSLFIYLLLSWPRPFQAAQSEINMALETTTPMPLPDPYRHLNNTEHREQIPLFNIPYLYKIKLKLYLPWKRSVDFGSRNFSADGQLAMYFTVAQTNNRVQVHSVGNHVVSLHIEDDFGRNITVAEISRDNPHVLDIITEHELIEHMNYSLHVIYTTSIHHSKGQFFGLFASEYHDDGEIKLALATHLQVQLARTFLPCIDVPEAKAKFETTLIHPAGTIALFNTKETSTNETDGNWTETRFEPSVPMSTYLVALAVSDFSHLEEERKGVRLRVYAPRSHISDVSLAMSVMSPILEYFEEFFQMPYPMNKLDIFVTPELKVMGMENWGLITIRARNLYFRESVSSQTDRIDVLEVICHEIAHQWFGNLVTMTWWNNVWLNEGFAVMMGNKAMERLGERMDLTAVKVGIALRTDQEPHKTVEVSRREEPTFDPEKQFQKAYTKPLLILKMVERTVGAASLKLGIGRFLQRFAYGTADHHDLMEALTYAHDSSSGSHLAGQSFSLSDFIESWIYQKGFPLVQLEMRDDGVQIARQMAYRHTGRLYPGYDEQQWKIPLFIRHPGTNEQRVEWLLENSTVAIDLGDDLLLDRDGDSYMRISYDHQTYLKIIEQLHTDKDVIPVQSRGRLIDDSMTLSEKGVLSYSVMFNLSTYLVHETEFVPVSMLSAHLDFLFSRMNSHPKYHVVQEFVLAILGPMFKRFMENTLAKDEEYSQILLRELVYRRVCLAGHLPCVQLAVESVKRLEVDCEGEMLSHECNKIPSFLRFPLYATAVMYGGKEPFDFLFEKVREEKFPAEVEKLWNGLSAAVEREQVHRLWELLLFNTSQKDFRQRCLEFSRYYHSHTHLLTYSVINKGRITSAGLSVIDIAYLFITLQRGMFTHDDYILFREVEDALLEPSKRDRTALARLETVISWRDSMGEAIIANMTSAMHRIKTTHP